MLPICLHIASETCHAGRSEAPTHPEKKLIHKNFSIKYIPGLICKPGHSTIIIYKGNQNLKKKYKNKIKQTSKQIEQKIQKWEKKRV
jgi:hypothetical protein